jgi:hypothetical protein
MPIDKFDAILPDLERAAKTSCGLIVGDLSESISPHCRFKKIGETLLVEDTQRELRRIGKCCTKGLMRHLLSC